MSWNVSHFPTTTDVWIHNISGGEGDGRNVAVLIRESLDTLLGHQGDEMRREDPIFPDKRAIFVALHKREVEHIDRMVETTLVEHAASSLRDLMTAIIEAMIDAHAADPRLYELLLSEVPHRAEGTQDFAVRLHGAFLLAISSRGKN
jgi:hypothetical protein